MTAILRFTDFETSTIDEHRAVLRRQGTVWWGWWKKEVEDAQLERLAAVSSSAPTEIGLVDRQAQRYHAARCLEVVYAEQGERIPSPQPARTPEYYAEATFPAWFLLTSFRELDKLEWESRFGATPTGEQTLFVVPEFNPVAATKTLQQSLEEPFRVDCPGSTILHLSDLHFGSDYAFPLAETATPTMKHDLVSLITRGLDRCACPPIGVVVISGDVTTRSEDKGFHEAQAFIERLLAALGLSIDHLVIVPGNHDIPLDPEHETRTYSAEIPFRNMLSGLLGRKVPSLDRIQWFGLPGGLDIFFVSLNSVRPRKRAFMEYGYVGADYYRPLLDQLSRLRDRVTREGAQRPVAIAVLHHHLLPTGWVEDPEENRPISLTLDAGKLVEDLQAAQVDLALHGHQHLPFVGGTSRVFQAAATWQVPNAPLWVIGCGSSGVAVTRLWNEMRNNVLGVYHVEEAKFRVRMLQYAPNVDLSDYMDITLPLVSSQIDPTG